MITDKEIELALNHADAVPYSTISAMAREIKLHRASIPTDKVIYEAARKRYGYGSYWQGVKTDAFREGAKELKKHILSKVAKGDQ